MPVVVSMLNSYSGWAAAAAGFMLGNDLLIITGALVGSSGAILSYIMCRGMNRSFRERDARRIRHRKRLVCHRPTSPRAKFIPSMPKARPNLMRQAKKVIIVPGYGLAVAQAQHSLAEVVRILRESAAPTSALPSIPSPDACPAI